MEEKIKAILDDFEQINAMPERRKTVVDEAVKYLTKGESIYTAPEGDLQEPLQLGQFYPGVARIYRKSRAPIIPMALVAPRAAMSEWPAQLVVEGRVYRTITVLRGPYLVNIGKPLLPDLIAGTDDERDEHVTEVVRNRIDSLAEDVRLNKFWL